MTPDRMTPSQYIAQRTGGDAETICALLADIADLKAALAERDARIAETASPPKRRR